MPFEPRTDVEIADATRGRGFNSTIANGQDMTRLEQIAGLEAPALQDRLRGELSQLQGVADRVGEEDAVNRSREAASRASANDKAQFERSTRGMDLSDRQKRVSQRRLGLSRSLNRASAAGDTRRGFADRSKAVKAAGSSFADAFFDQRVGAQTNLAQLDASRTSVATQEHADQDTDALENMASFIGFFSSEDLKHDHGHEAELLSKLKKVRVNRWQYKGDSKTHVGPFSEEFNREFGIDTDRPDMINVIDALGVTMGAIKELDKKVEARGQR